MKFLFDFNRILVESFFDSLQHNSYLSIRNYSTTQKVKRRFERLLLFLDLRANGSERNLFIYDVWNLKTDRQTGGNLSILLLYFNVCANETFYLVNEPNA